MVEVKMFNHGIFQQYLNNKLDYLFKEKVKEVDPYKKWNLEEQIRLTEEFLNAYKTTVEVQLGNGNKL